MTDKFHIGKNGVAPCGATKRKCRYEQFTALPQAEIRYQEQVVEEQGKLVPSTKSKKSNASVANDVSKNWLGITKIDEHGYLTDESERLISTKGAYCSECSRELTAREISTMLTYPSTIQCDCGEVLSMNTGVEVRINEDHPSYPALDKENISKMTWYHSTAADESFAESLNAKDVPNFDAIHLGTKIASFDRGVTNSPLRNSSLRSSNNTDFEEFYLYEVEVDEDALVQEDIEEDDNGEYKLIDDETGVNVVRYYNLWEDTASISLAVNPKKITVKSVRKVSREEAYSCPSPMNMRPLT